MQTLIEPFKNAACELVAAVPDIFLLPHNPQGWSLMVDGSDCWLRTSLLFGMRLEADSALAVLNSAWHEQAPAHVQVYGEIPTELTTWLTAKHPFNFLQGKFAVKTKSSLSGYWRYAAIFVAISFTAQLAYDAARIVQYNRIVKTTKAESVKLYQTLFPEERRVVNLRRQVEAHLAEQQNAGHGFVSVATKMGEVLNTGSWQTQRIDFDNNGLLLEIDAQSLSDLEQLRQQLTNQGLTTETLSANSQGTGIRGRLRISESS
jgi:general secretion pathway protein L